MSTGTMSEESPFMNNELSKYNFTFDESKVIWKSTEHKEMFLFIDTDKDGLHTASSELIISVQGSNFLTLTESLLWI